VLLYTEEQKRLCEDLEHGLILGTSEFVKRLRDAFLSDSPQKKERCQHRKVRIDADPFEIIHKAAAMFEVDIRFCGHSRRIPKEAKESRDLLAFFHRETRIADK